MTNVRRDLESLEKFKTLLYRLFIVVTSPPRDCSKAVTTLATIASAPSQALAEAPQKMFAPGGTLVDYQVGVTVGNDRASKSRRNDNSNVVFGQDYYYKFGTAPTFIPKGDTSFPVKMPFVLSQQRYDTKIGPDGK